MTEIENALVSFQRQELKQEHSLFQSMERERCQTIVLGESKCNRKGKGSNGRGQTIVLGESKCNMLSCKGNHANQGPVFVFERAI
jgi:hypothetical protein